MYLNHYKLKELPFSVTPDPKFFFPTARHRTALNHLLFGIRQRKGFVLLTGEVGAGKTTLCRNLLNNLGEDYHTALILNPKLTATQLLRAIVAEFGIDNCSREAPRPSGRDRLGCINRLNSFLLKVNEAGGDAVLIIDEAQDMSTELLETVRLLSNMETDSRKLLQIVLVGQPELREKINGPALRQLAQRITVRYHLEAMNRIETAGYLHHRLLVAGGAGQVRFDEKAIDEIHDYSGGTPRLINAISDRTLLAGFLKGAAEIDGEIVQLAIRDMKEAA
ncbi:MAG: AAA family ATPase [Planctomycetota bacterium]|nr:AAA family ATPase [Planctomycetota bacterium]